MRKFALLSLLIAGVVAMIWFERPRPSPATDGHHPVLNGSRQRDGATNDTWRLDTMAQDDTQSAGFADAVERFYGAIEKKDWSTVYDMRTPEFKYDVSRDLFLKTAGDQAEVASYRILDIHTYANADGLDIAAELVIEFAKPGSVTYGSARWKKREGKWLCDDTGLPGLLGSTRVPDWTRQ